MSLISVKENITLNDSSWQDPRKLPLVEDDLVDSWLLMSSPTATVAVVAGYLAFVKVIGPRIMENKKPYELKLIMQPYNVLQVVWNMYLVAMLFTTNGALKYLYDHVCQPLDVNILRPQMCVAMWHYTVLKFLDLFDTVFFVLRKKQGHVTFLHVYHHSAMALFSWGTLKYLRGEQGVLLGVMNAFVHVVMYSYYFLAALGDSMKPYLWWKRYLTTLQITQFVIGVVYLSSLIVMNCNLPKIFTYIWCSQIIIFLGLFVNFYIKSYVVRKPVSEEAGPSSKEKRH